MAASTLGEVLGAHAELGGPRPGQRGWVAAMLAALPHAAEERIGFYAPAMIAAVAPPPGDATAMVACTRFAATSMACNAAFAYVARVDGAQFLLGIQDVTVFARAAIERIAELRSRPETAGVALGPRWTALVEAAIELTERYLRYQQTLPVAAGAITDPAAAAAVRAAAQAAHPIAGAALDLPRQLASVAGEAEVGGLADQLDGALAAVERALPTGSEAVAVVAATRAAIAPWRAAAIELAQALAAGRAAAASLGGQLDAAAGDADERWRLTAVVVAQVREALAIATGSLPPLARARGVAGELGASLAAAAAPFEAAVARLSETYGAVDAAALAVWGPA